MGPLFKIQDYVPVGNAIGVDNFISKKENKQVNKESSTLDRQTGLKRILFPFLYFSGLFYTFIR